MHTKSLYILLIALCLGLQSCAGVKDAVNPYDEHFHCRATDQEGRCVDTPTAYKDARHPAATVTPDPARTMKEEELASQYRTVANLLKSPRTPLLRPPKILRVLILPYQGEHNELFMTRYAYLEVRPPAWVLSVVREKIPED
jgi:conjugal transfer pilus assembly protein TraV